MPRISRLAGLRSLQSAVSSASSAQRTSFAAAASRAMSTSQPALGPNTEWVRGKLWKGEAPGAEDPYTQRVEYEKDVTLPSEVLELERSSGLVQPGAHRTQLTLPPQRTEAVTEKEAQAIDPNYTPATTLEELEEVGTLASWWEEPGHWSEKSTFKGFAQSAKTTDRDVIELNLRRALVETLALKQAGKFPKWATLSWGVGSRADLEQAVSAPIDIKDGVPHLSAPISTETLISGSPLAKHLEPISPEEAREMLKGSDPSWKDIVLDSESKFALRKRLYQLTGNLIPDVRLGAARTVKHVLTLASKQPAPKKLAETLAQRGDLAQLANVSVHNRRITPIDKEIAVGRWKVIEEELKKRDLPVTGTGGLKKYKEMDWVLGNQ